MNGGSSVSYLARTPCVPLFCTLSNRGGNRRAFGLPGEGGDHFHCAEEPSPGHFQCRYISWVPRRTHKLFCPVNRPVVPGLNGPSPEQNIYVCVPPQSWFLRPGSVGKV